MRVVSVMYVAPSYDASFYHQMPASPQQAGASSACDKIVERVDFRHEPEKGKESMTRLRVGIIGTGRKKERPDAMGFAMAYAHADAYQALSDQCELVACADIVQENAEAFARATGIPQEGIFTDYK